MAVKYCKDCESIRMVGGQDPDCYTYIKNQATGYMELCRGQCTLKNKNNDCPDFKRTRTSKIIEWRRRVWVGLRSSLQRPKGETCNS